MSKRKIVDYLMLYLKGVAMGAADLVPGVSGGTIALISGIYQELLSSISRFDLRLISKIKKQGFASIWNYLNASFLISIVAGIFTSLFTLAKGISWLLENRPILIWSFFFGLLVSSVLLVLKQISKWNTLNVIGLAIGAVFAYYITIVKPIGYYDNSYIFLIFSGALAVCAMILPGISGAFILVLLGVYEPVINAVHQKNIVIIALVLLGAILGLLAFSKGLKWLFKHRKGLTLSVLAGFLIGSLNKVWPWKQVLLWRTNSQGVEVALLEKSILPSQYEFLGNEPQVVWSLSLSVLGFLIILIMEKIANNNTKV